MKNPQSNLPPGFRFHPTDEELILHYLRKKVASRPFPVSIIADVDIYKFDPWDLPAKAALGEKEWYFFSPRDRKYPNGARPNRAAASGYWKATGTDKIIMASNSTMACTGGGGGGGGQDNNIGVKKALVFYRGKPPKGVKTNWIMHEYRLADTPSSYNNNKTMIRPKDSSMRLDDWVLCRIYKKYHALTSSVRAATSSEQEAEEVEEQFAQENFLPGLKSPMSNKCSGSTTTSLMPQKSCSFTNLLDAIDYSLLSSFLTDTAQLINTTGTHESNPTMLNCATIQQDPPFSFINSHNNITASNISTTNMYSSSHFIQKYPQLISTSSSTPNDMENNCKLKRQLPHIDEDVLQPSKKLMNSCSFSNNNSSSGSSQNDLGKHNYLGQPFLNQQLLLSPHHQFQG